MLNWREILYELHPKYWLYAKFSVELYCNSLIWGKSSKIWNVSKQLLVFGVDKINTSAYSRVAFTLQLSQKTKIE